MGEGEESCICCYKTQRLFPHIEGLAQHLWRDLFQRCQPGARTAFQCVYLCFLWYIETRGGGSHWLAGGGLLERTFPVLCLTCFQLSQGRMSLSFSPLPRFPGKSSHHLTYQWDLFPGILFFKKVLNLPIFFLTLHQPIPGMERIFLILLLRSI